MEISVEYLKTFFAKNPDYYIEKWNEFKSGKKVSFKPYAFLFGMFWFLYRKMYKETLIIFLLLILEGIVEEYFVSEIFHITEGSRKVLDFLMICLVAGFTGMFGDYLYFKSSERKINKILSRGLSEEEKFNALKKTRRDELVIFVYNRIYNGDGYIFE